MATMVNCFANSGIDSYLVNIEIKMMEGQPMITVIGLGDQAVKEAAERIQSAIDECGYQFPKKKIIISLAPSNMKKSGSHYDLAMAVGVLQQGGEIAGKNLTETGFIGELALNGKLRPCRGILPMVITAARMHLKRVIVPLENVKEASLVKNIEIIGLDSLTDVIHYVEGKEVPQKEITQGKPSAYEEKTPDFIDVVGQQEIIETVTLAAAGGHNMLMIGTPGCGKTMIASRIPSILPDMTEKECLEVTKIYSISGLLPTNHELMRHRPFRAPHHNASLNALIGGGADAMPGEVSLAHNGVLFLDELAEFSKRTLDALRQPLEDKKVSISRVNGSHTFPSNFMFITAMNPCPCGYYPDEKCRCTDYEIIKYRGKISGPILDRIDIQKQVRPIDYFDAKESPGISSEILKAKVLKAREIQQKRFANEPGINCNAQMNTALLKEYCELDDTANELLRATCTAYGYSARVVHKLLRLARTSADLRGNDRIDTTDIAAILECRDLDKSNSKMLVVK